MLWSELKDKSSTELQRQLAIHREQLRDARFKVSQDQLKDVRRVRSLKRTVARLLTRLRQLTASSTRSA